MEPPLSPLEPVDTSTLPDAPVVASPLAMCNCPEELEISVFITILPPA